MKMDVAYAIRAIVDSILIPQRLLYIAIQAEYGYKQFSSYRTIHFMFQRPANYTKVLMYVEKEKRLYSDITEVVEKFKFMTDHTSCWFDDGVRTPLHQLGITMANEVDTEYTEKTGESTGCSPLELNGFTKIITLGLYEGNINVNWDTADNVSVVVDLGKKIGAGVNHVYM